MFSEFKVHVFFEEKHPTLEAFIADYYLSSTLKIYTHSTLILLFCLKDTLKQNESRKSLIHVFTLKPYTLVSQKKFLLKKFQVLLVSTCLFKKSIKIFEDIKSKLLYRLG